MSGNQICIVADELGCATSPTQLGPKVHPGKKRSISAPLRAPARRAAPREPAAPLRAALRGLEGEMGPKCPGARAEPATL